jgi:hypothetical protein
MKKKEKNENVGKSESQKGNNYGTLREPSRISPIVSAGSAGDHESGLIKFNGTCSEGSERITRNCGV